MYKGDATKVLTGEARLSYCALVTPRENLQGGDPKYSVTLLIPKSDLATKADIDQSIEAAIRIGITSKWGGVRPNQIVPPVYDGDGPRPKGGEFGEECKGHWVISARSKLKPDVVDVSNVHCQLAPTDIYSGMYARVTINFYPFATGGNKGIGCGLGNVMKTRDGEPLGGRTSAANDFAEFEQQAPVPGYPAPAAPYPQAPVPEYPQAPAPAPIPAYQPAPVPVYPAPAAPYQQDKVFNPLTGVWE